MGDFERAAAFEEALREQAADRVAAFRWGTAILTESLRHVWDLNLLRVERPGATAAELANEADRIQGEAGLGHRRVATYEESLAAGFQELGWETNRFAFMRYDRDAPGETATAAEVGRERLAAIREFMVRQAPWADDEEAVQQVLAAQRRTAEAGRARHFAVLVDGEAVSAADLLSDGRIAQVEDVVTLEAHRGRGYGSAVIRRAVAEALAGGHELVFLVADDEDWPKELYGRLGFEPLGRKWAFQKGAFTGAS